MKKRLSLLLLSSLFISLAACNNETKEPEDVNKYQEIKNLINKIEDASFKKEGFKIHLSEKYDMESHIDNELEKGDYSFKYEGLGSFTVAYQDGDMGVDGIAQLVTSGTGFLNSLQQEKIEYEFKGLDKVENKTKDEKIQTETSYGFDLLFYNNEAKLHTVTLETDNIKNESVENEFAGKINQSLLNSDSSKAIESFMADMIIMDGYYTAEEVEKYSIGKILDSKTMSNQDFNKFVEENEIKIEDGDNHIFLKFCIDYTDEVKKIFDIDNSKRIKIDGSIGFDLDNYELEYYRYNLKDYFEYIFNGKSTEEKDDNQRMNIEEFMIEGESVRIGYDIINYNVELTEYTDAQEFINDFINNALPKNKHNEN